MVDGMAGKGDRPRSYGQKYRENYEKIFGDPIKRSRMRRELRIGGGWRGSGKKATTPSAGGS